MSHFLIVAVSALDGARFAETYEAKDFKSAEKQFHKDTKPADQWLVAAVLEVDPESLSSQECGDFSPMRIVG